MEFLTKKVTDKYPDLVTLTQIYHELFEQEEPDGEAGDDKYRPLLLLLAILFKIQERKESSAKVSRGRELSPEHYQETLEQQLDEQSLQLDRVTEERDRLKAQNRQLLSENSVLKQQVAYFQETFATSNLIGGQTQM